MTKTETPADLLTKRFEANLDTEKEENHQLDKSQCIRPKGVEERFGIMHHTKANEEMLKKCE